MSRQISEFKYLPIILITQCLLSLTLNGQQHLNSKVEEPVTNNNFSKSDSLTKFPKNYIGTTAFMILSVFPKINYYEIDYGHKLNDKSNLWFAFLFFKNPTPMSNPYSDTTKYPGYVNLYGLAIAYQRFIWKKLFILTIINPSLLNYHNNNNRINNGFMLLFCERAGYQFDYTIFKQPMYLQIGAEFNYWPLNFNAPNDFRQIDNKFHNYVFSPVLNIGYKF